MKNLSCLLLVFTLLFSQSFLSAQPNLLTKHHEIFDIEAGLWNRISKISLEYDASDKLIAVDSLIWDTLNLNWKLASRRVINYSDNLGSNDWVETGFFANGTTFDYGEGFEKYNNNGCLVEKQTAHFPIGFNPQVEKIEYELDENCQIQKAIFYRFDVIGGLILDKTIDYTYTDNSIRMDIERFNYSPQLSEFKYFDYKEYDSEGRISLHEFTIFISGISGRMEYQYNWSDQEEKFAEIDFYYYNPDGSVDTTLENQYQLITKFDKKDRITHQDYFDDFPFPINISTNLFKYYCNDLVKEKRNENLFTLEFEREFYEYQHQPNCETELENYLKISPNPSQNYLKIESNLLTNEDANLRIFSMDGKLIFERNVNSVASFIEINVADFSSGTYIIRIDSANTNVVDKVLIIK